MRIVAQQISINSVDFDVSIWTELH
jgi:hypothetical protein